MTHLTTKQVLQFVDGTLDYASQAQCTNHLAVCERCRKEVDFQKAIAKTSRRQPVVRTSSGFVRRVMTRVVPQHEKTWKARVIDNLGNVFAMAMVLTILGYAITNPSLFKVQEQSSQQSVIPQSVSAVYAKIVQSVAERADVATKQVLTSTGTEGNKIILLTVVSLFILVALDQFVLKRYIGMKMPH
jgi:anti-sigma factor RsiW